ncbi:hypothetical protein NLJ89_g2898 [Agrocybe chaxingu]|uniref:Uncharacterized protein n=1 Tax=Agrocybe chaxingu TaxID=84603 RepID=A0A9W8K3I5_9AGAR|nr:hypothetical protein NLJ89_g2898 [Agrocybe chaxingu]
MADSRTGAATHLDAEFGARSYAPDDHAQNSSPTSAQPPSSYSKSTSKRAVRSTRTPIGARDGEPQRSQTVPLPGGSSSAGAQSRRGVRPPPLTSTMPLPDTRQRKTSSHANEPYNPQVAYSDYIVEPFPSPSAEQQNREHNDNPYLAFPPPMPVPITDVRHSTSSFQTEPSSYYSLEDNWSSVGGPPPPMPRPSTNKTEDAEPDMTVPGFRRTSPIPSMPAPDIPSPSMPVPSLPVGANLGQRETRENDPHGTIHMPGAPSQLYPPPSPRRQRLSGTPPIPPTPTSPPPQPPIPTPELPRPGVAHPHHQSTAQPSGFNQAGNGQGPPKPIKLPPTAPLKIHHHPPRPISAATSSSSGGPAGTVTIFPQPGSGRVSNAHAQPSGSRIDSLPGGKDFSRGSCVPEAHVYV